jgi:hypothetical protein
MTTSQIEALGAALSQKNTGYLKQAWVALTEVLVASGNLSFSDVPKELISAQSVYDAQKKEIAAAGLLSEMVNMEAWQQKLRVATEYFSSMFYAAVSDQVDKEARIADLLSDFQSLVKDLAANAPNIRGVHGDSRNKIFASDHQTTEPEQQSELQLKSETILDLATTVAEDKSEAAGVATETELITSLDQLFDESIALEEQLVQASEETIPLLEQEGTVTLQIEARARFDTSATNERVVEGILFKIDSPSEAIPNVGPGLPLYIPRAVALEALACLDFSRPKPLDAHNSLSQHASTEIVGAMTSARVDGDDFWVSGVLWDHNQPHKVEAISASQDHLGMSVNATAEGHPTEIDGRSVWQIDRLRILGANILFAEKATFKKTRTNVMAGTEAAILIPVLASASESEIENPIPDTSESMDIQAVATQITQLSENVAAMHNEVKTRLNSLEPTVAQLSAQMSAIQAAAQEAKNQEVQAAAMQQEQEKQAQLLQNLSQLIEEKMAAIVPPTKGGLKYPSKPLPLAASGVPATSGAGVIQLQLAELTGEIRAIEKNPYPDTQTWIELVDRKKALEQQLNPSAQ